MYVWFNRPLKPNFARRIGRLGSAGRLETKLNQILLSIHLFQAVISHFWSENHNFFEIILIYRVRTAILIIMRLIAAIFRDDEVYIWGLK